MENIQELSNEMLVSELKKLCAVEKQTTAEVVRYLAEVDSRKLYRELGFPSLHAFCVIGLGYSEGSTFRRMEAARLLAKNSEVYELLNEGRVSLCSLGQVARVITPENKAEVLTLVQGMGKQDAQRLAARYQAPQKVKRETIRAKKTVVPYEMAKQSSNTSCEITSTVEVECFSISTEIDAECMELLNEAKEFAGHKKICDVLKIALKEYVARRRPKAPKVEKAVCPRLTKPESRVLSSTRYIKREVRDSVRIRDNGQCSFVATDGVRCCERRGLQYDHIVPFAKGGWRTADNLRLLCPAHNQMHAELSFGKEFMDNKRNQRKA